MKLVLALVLLIIGPAENARAQNEESPDLVPRDRLVTVTELINLLDPELRPRGADAAKALAAHLRNRSRPRYFFTLSELDERLRDYRGRYAEAVERSAETTGSYLNRFGADVIWMVPGTDLEGTPHDPNVVRFLAKQANAVDFALAHLLTGEDHLPFIRAHVRDFVSDYEAGLTQGEPNDVFERFYAGHRTRNWLMMHHLLRADERYEADDEVYMLRVFLLHGARLYDQSRRFNWGNHQLHGLAGLYEMTLMYPELPVMRFWNEQALELLLEHLEKEIETDGFHFERASHYHLLDIINYFRVYRLAELNEVELPPLYGTRFRNMFDAVVALSLPRGDLPIMQDVSANFDLRSEPIDREMALGALLFSDPEYRYLSSDKLPPEHYWFFPPGAAEAYERLIPREPSIRSTALAASGYYVMRTGWGKDDLYMLIDGGLAQEKPDHTQGGILGVIASGFGDQFLPNYPVMYRHPSYKTLKNSYAKNVAIVDGRPQGRNWVDNKSRTGFGIWKTLPEPRVQEWTSGERFDVFRGTHDGYEDLGVTYAREVYFVKPFFWVVIDHFRSPSVHSFSQIWQGRYVIPPYSPEPFYHEGTSYHLPDSPTVYRAVQEGPNSRLHVVQADTDRMTVNTRRDHFVESVVFEADGYNDYTFTTLLYPESRSSEEAPAVRHFRRTGDFEEIIATAGDVSSFIYLSEDDELEVERVRTDAGRIVLTYEVDDLQALLLTAGSEVFHADFSLHLDRDADVEAARTETGWTLTLLSGDPVSGTFSSCDRESPVRLAVGHPYRVTSSRCALTSRP